MSDAGSIRGGGSVGSGNEPPFSEGDTLSEEVLGHLRRAFEERIPFNALLGIRVEAAGLDRVVLGFDKSPEKVGNFVRGTLHGGVISAVLDATGGLVAFVNALQRVRNADPEEQMGALARIGTIDLRVDYLRGATGERYRATGHILRAGSRVAVTRMELHDENDRLVATGTGTYMIA